MFSWYNSENMGTLADWVGIAVTVITVFLTIRYYSKDNEKKLGIIVYPKHAKKTENYLIYRSSPAAIEFYSFNQSKIVIAVEYVGIRVKKNKKIFSKKKFEFLEKTYENISDFIDAEDKPPAIYFLDSGEKTDVQFLSMEDIYNFILNNYTEKALKKKKKIKFEIVYTIFNDGKQKESTIHFFVLKDDILRFKKNKSALQAQ